MRLREKLLALAALQKVDLEIASLKKSAQTYPIALGELEKELGAARSASDAEKSKLVETERQESTLKQTIVDEKDKVKKWETRLTEQRSTREYSALAREIDIAKKSNLTMAEELVELGKALIIAREAAKAKETQFFGRQAELSAKMGELKGELQGLEGQVKTLEGKREEVAKGVERDLLRRYDHTRKKRLPAMASLVPPGTCTGCRMNIPPQLYNTLRTNLGFDICPSCQRIIYAAEALEAPVAAK
jgi:predicted  nucleic acid-binding Zn-ribbon protein